MALTIEQYKQLRQAGLTPEEISSQQSGGRVGGIVGGAGRFLGVEEFGRGIGAALSGGAIKSVQEGQRQIVGQQEKTLQQIRQNRIAGKDVSRLETALGKTIDTNASRDIIDIGTAGGLTGPKIVGSAGLTGLNILSAGLPITKGIVAGAKQGAQLGAAFGGAEALRSDQAMIPSLLKGAALGGVAGGLFGAAQNVITNLTTKTPERLASKVLRQGKTDLSAEVSGKRPVLAKQFVERGIRGSDESIIENGTANLVNLEKQVQNTLSRNKNTSIDTVHIIRALDELVRRKRNVYGQAGVESINEFKKQILDHGNKMSVLDANQLKRDLYKELSDAAFAKDVLPQNKEVLRSVASSIRKELVRAVPALKKLNEDQQFWIRTIDAIEGRVRGTQKLNEIGLSDTIFAASAIASGQPAALAAGALKRGVELTQFRTTGAQVLKNIRGGIEALPTDAAGKISRQAVLNLLGKLVNQ